MSLDMINNDLESIKQDYLNLIEQINLTIDDKDLSLKIDESVAVNVTNLKTYRDSIGTYLKSISDKRAGDLTKVKDIQTQLDDANKKLESKTEEYTKLKNENNVNGKTMKTTMDELGSLEYNFNLQFNIFIGLVVLICLLYLITTDQINGNTGFIVLVVGIVLLFSYYYYKK